MVDCALRDGLESTRLGTGQVTAELEGLQRAIASTASDLAALVTKVETQVGGAQRIFSVRISLSWPTNRSPRK